MVAGGLVVKSCLSLVTSWTVACQDPLSMGFSRQQYWSGWPFPSPGDLPNPGNEPRSPALQADSLPSKPPGKPEVRPVNCSRLKKPGAGLPWDPSLA